MLRRFWMLLAMGAVSLLQLSSSLGKTDAVGKANISTGNANRLIAWQQQPQPQPTPPPAPQPQPTPPPSPPPSTAHA